MFDNKALKKLIIPLIIENALSVMVGIADTIMVSGVGEAAVSGVSLIDSITLLILNIFQALGTGGAIVVAQYIGRKEPQMASKVAKQLVISVAFVSAIFAVICIIFNRQLISTIYGDIEADVMRNSMIYFYISAISYPFIALFNGLAALFRAEGNSKMPMYAAGLMNGINVSFNAIFIFGFGLGVLGAGVATLMARIAASTILMVQIRKGDYQIRIDSFLKIRPDFAIIKNVLRVGIPNGLEGSIFQVGKLLVATIVADFGKSAITANAVASTVAGLEVIPGSAIGLAILTVVGQCVGAGEHKQAMYYTKKLMKLIYIVMGALNVLILIASPYIVQIYNLSEQTASLAIQMMFVHGFFCIFFWPASFSLPNALRASNDSKFTMIVSVTSMWTCRIGLSYVICYTLGMGAVGIWVAMAADWVVRGAIFVHRVWKKKLVNKALI